MTNRTGFRPCEARDRLIVALDLASCEDAENMVAHLGDEVTFYKIGMELAFAGGLGLVPRLRAMNKQVFIDLKLLDIDNTIAGGVRSIGRLGATFTTIHAYPSAQRAAVGARGDTGLGLLGVTVLTSMDDADLDAAGYRHTAERLVLMRARDAAACGMDGIVCSPREAASVRAEVGEDLVIVTPGVRPANAGPGDQKRTMTPSEAIAAGSDYLVVGRPVTADPDPRAAAARLIEDIKGAL